MGIGGAALLTGHTGGRARLTKTKHPVYQLQSQPGRRDVVCEGACAYVCETPTWKELQNLSMILRRTAGDENCCSKLLFPARWSEGPVEQGPHVCS